MATITFDTHKFVKVLQAAGITPEQAEAFVGAQQEILAQALDTALARRSDIDRLEKKLIAHDGEFKLLKWILSFIAAGVASLVLKAFF